MVKTKLIQAILLNISQNTYLNSQCVQQDVRLHLQPDPVLPLRATTLPVTRGAIGEFVCPVFPRGDAHGSDALAPVLHQSGGIARGNSEGSGMLMVSGGGPVSAASPARTIRKNSSATRFSDAVEAMPARNTHLLFTLQARINTSYLWLLLE